MKKYYYAILMFGTVMIAAHTVEAKVQKLACSEDNLNDLNAKKQCKRACKVTYQGRYAGSYDATGHKKCEAGPNTEGSGCWCYEY